MVSQDIGFYVDDPESNVYASFTLKIDLLINGVIPATLFDEIELLATFHPDTGEWSEIQTYGTFLLNQANECVDAPAVSEWGMVVVLLGLVTAISLVARRPVSKMPISRLLRGGVFTGR